MSGILVIAEQRRGELRPASLELIGAAQTLKQGADEVAVAVLGSAPEQVAGALKVQGVDEIITVSDAAIVRAMRQMWEVLKIVVEPSAAVPYAALLEAPAALRGRRIGVIVSGGNLDLDHLPWSEPA